MKPKPRPASKPPRQHAAREAARPRVDRLAREGGASLPGAAAPLRPAGGDRPDGKAPARQPAAAGGAARKSHVVQERPGRRGRSSGSSATEAASALAALPVAVGRDYEAEIIGIGHSGEGVGRVSGFTLFVPGALPGERALVRVEHLKKQYGYAKLLQVLQASSDRVAPPCGIYDECGGCQLQHLDYAAQLRIKRQIVVDNLTRIGKLRVAGEGEASSGGEADIAVSAPYFAAASPSHAVIVHPTLGMMEPWRYRNKVQVPIGEEEGGLIGGFYAQGTHRIIDMQECLIQHNEGDRVVETVKRIGRGLGVTAYQESTHTGLLRHVMVKVGFRTGEIMVVLVTNGATLPHEDEWVERIRAAIPDVASICHNINEARTNVILGDRTIVLWGREVIYDYIGDVKFAISVAVSP